MNTIQKKYIKAKAAYETAFKMGRWDLVDQLEDPMIEAEFALVDWAFEVAVKSGQMSKEDTDFMRRNSNGEQWEKLVDLALRMDSKQAEGIMAGA